ncbi:Retrovirus-related Pol polyprotein, partial [Fragariocoptes setiger]
MTRDITTYIRGCERCAERKRVRGIQPGLMCELAASRPFEIVAVDFLVELPETAQRNKLVLVAVDHFSRYIKARVLPDRKTDKVVKFLVEQVFDRHRAPVMLVSDNALELTSSAVKEVLAAFGCEQHLASAMHHTGNSVVERVHQSLMDKLALINKPHERKRWDENLQLSVFACNTSYHEALDTTPFRIIHGRSPRLPGSVSAEKPSRPSEYATMIKQRIEEIAEAAAAQSHLKSKQRFDTHKKQASKYEPGDRVYRFEAEIRGPHKKLENRCRSWSYDMLTAIRISSGMLSASSKRTRRN